MSVFATLIAAPDWVPLERAHWPWLLALGLLAAIGQYLLTEAFRSGPLALVAPFEYTSLLWGILIDWVVWHVLPSARVCLGGSVVIASGLYLLWHARSHGAGDNATVMAVERAAGQNVAPIIDSGYAARKQEEDSP
jgi:drug/metabolite transporter (DMT)-like permease